MAVPTLLAKRRLLRLCQVPSSSVALGVPDSMWLGSLGPESGQDGGMGWHGLQSHTSVGRKSRSALAGCVTADRFLNPPSLGFSSVREINLTSLNVRRIQYVLQGA